MRACLSVVPLLLCACGPRETRPVSFAEVKNEVRAFTGAVAENVTRRGPFAWQDYFEDSPAFFMAVDGHVEFADGAAARAAIPGLNRAIRKIELQWGDGLRVDPLTQDLAVIGSPWHEVMTFADGRVVDSSGYFTAIAERNASGDAKRHWQFRNAHWSTTQATGGAK